MAKINRPGSPQGSMTLGAFTQWNHNRRNMIVPPIAPHLENTPLCLLHLEDSDADHALVARILSREFPGCSIDRTDTLPDFQSLIQARTYDVILADYRLAGFTALQAWDFVHLQQNGTPFVLVSGAIGESAAVEAIQSGMSDYVSKTELEKLARVVRRAMEMQSARDTATRAAAELALSERRLAAFAEHLQGAIETERAAIAREIHDDIGGALAAVRLDLAWVARHSVDSAVLSHTQAAEEMLQHALSASQRIMMDLRPAILEQGLLAALQWLIGSFERRTGTKVRWTGTLEDSASYEKQIQLTAYRTAQEALTNISKYAPGANVYIDISDAEQVLTLEIRDEGGGISQSDLDKPSSFGLRGLRERAKIVGGWLDISTRAGAGTAVILSIPLNTARPQPQGSVFA